MPVERGDPAVCSGSNNMGGNGDMRKTPNSLQDLSKSLYDKAKAEPTKRFWGLYVHVCKKETLQEAHRMAKKNNGAPGIDGVTFEAIEESGAESFLQQISDELIANTYRPMRCGRRKYRKTGERSEFSRSLLSVIVWFREHSSSFWNRFSKRTSNRDRTDIDRNAQRMKR
jgi:retron-type reverse transcriptase